MPFLSISDSPFVGASRFWIDGCFRPALALALRQTAPTRRQNEFEPHHFGAGDDRRWVTYFRMAGRGYTGPKLSLSNSKQSIVGENKLEVHSAHTWKNMLQRCQVNQVKWKSKSDKTKYMDQKYAFNRTSVHEHQRFQHAREGREMIRVFVSIVKHPNSLKVNGSRDRVLENLGFQVVYKCFLKHTPVIVYDAASAFLNDSGIGSLPSAGCEPYCSQFSSKPFASLCRIYTMVEEIMHELQKFMAEELCNDVMVCNGK